MEALMLITSMLMISALIFHLYKRAGQVKNTEKIIPGPSFLQGLKSFLRGSYKKNLHLYLSEWAQKYGEIVLINLWAGKVVIINDSSTFQRLVKAPEFRNFTNDRPPSYYGQHYAVGNSNIFFVNAGPELKYRRKLFHGLLKFYGEGIGRFEQLMVQTLTELADELRHQNKVNLPDTVKNYMLNLISFLMTGEVSEAGDRKLASIEEFCHWDDITTSFTHDATLHLFPFLTFIPGLRFKQCDQGMLKSIKNLHENYFEDMKKTFDPKNKRGFIDEMLSIQQELEEEGKASQLDDDCIKGLIQDTVSAALTTTSSALSLLFLQLIKNPDIQDKLYTEAKSVIGDSIPSFQHRQVMPYTEAVILETLRFASTAPLLGQHYCNQDIIFDGYRIPKSTILIMNAFYNHHRADYWEDPFAFKPERFLTSDGKLVEITHPARQNLIPFGTGPRGCPGETFAKSRMFLITVFLVREFHFSADGNSPLPSSDPREWISGITIGPAEYTCVVNSRV